MGKTVLLTAAILIFCGIGFLLITELIQVRATMPTGELIGHSLMTIAILLIVGFMIFLLTQIDTDYI